MKKDMLPVIAALIIAVLVLPYAGAAVPKLPNFSTVATAGIASVVTIPEDDLKRNTGVMVLGLDPDDYEIDLTNQLYYGKWYTDSLCAAEITLAAHPLGLIVGPEISEEGFADYTDQQWVDHTFYRRESGLCVPHTFLDPWGTAPWNKGYWWGMDLLSQHKILATLNGVPTKPNYYWCEIVEKEKAKIPPMTSKTPSLRQVNDEIIKTTVKDVTSNFLCKFRWVKPGVGVLDVYFIGPKVKNFIADHMLIVTVGYNVAGTTVWASELQDICILGWSMAEQGISVWLFKNPGLSTVPMQNEYYVSWTDAIHEFVSCDEAAAWQLIWLAGGWPYAPLT